MASSALERVTIRVPHPETRGKRFSRNFAACIRWLHIYVSLLSFSALVFFGATGITLNHPAWFNAEAHRVVEHQGTMPREWLSDGSEKSAGTESEFNVAKLEIAEHLRSEHRLRGAISEFRVDERECLVLFKGPGYSADAIVDRTSGAYSVNVTMMGFVAIMNDLHKGRDTGQVWSVMIDLISLATLFVSLTGLILILYIRRKRMAGILTTLAGTVMLVAIAIWLIQA